MLSQWAQQEVASMDLGDPRLDARAAGLLCALGNHPQLSIPAACRGHAEVQAAYRFFDNDKVTFDKVLAPHCQRTLERMSEQEIVLLVQDTSEIDLSRPEQQVSGAGDLDGSRRGIFLHDLQAFTPDGTPLGTLWAEYINRTEPVSLPVSSCKTSGKKQDRKHKPIEQKESIRWINGLAQAQAAAVQLPQVQSICIADSEADIYEWFALQMPVAKEEAGPKVDWLIRACQNRALQTPEGQAGNEHLREQVLSTPVLYTAQLQVRSRVAKTKIEKRSRRQSRDDREIQVKVRAATLTLRPPWRADRKLPAVTVNVVLVSESNPPKGEPGIEWILMTTLPIETLEQVRRVVEYYCVRWNIEILFRTLKSGCRIEQRQFEDVERILPCLAMYLIVAWRTMFVCRLGRECPDADCEVLFETSEWKAVWTATHHVKPPGKPPRLMEMVRLIAGLGGYIQRPGSEPGVQTIWIGLQRMRDLAWAWEVFGPKTPIHDQ